MCVRESVCVKESPCMCACVRVCVCARGNTAQQTAGGHIFQSTRQQQTKQGTKRSHYTHVPRPHAHVPPLVLIPLQFPTFLPPPLMLHFSIPELQRCQPTQFGTKLLLLLLAFKQKIIQTKLPAVPGHAHT